MEKNIISAAEVFLAFKKLKAGNAAWWDEIQLEMLKALNRGVIWLTRVCQVVWCIGRKDWHTGVIIPIHKEENREALTTVASFSLASLEKCM